MDLQLSLGHLLYMGGGLVRIVLESDLRNKLHELLFNAKVKLRNAEILYQIVYNNNNNNNNNNNVL
jgi:hypothetical protein